jgi:hypothetical protein
LLQSSYKNALQPLNILRLRGIAVREGFTIVLPRKSL